MPEQATVDIRKAKRGDRVYIDVLQNARGHHAVPPYVLRAVPGATVSTPLDWREVTDKARPGGLHAEEGRRQARHAARPTRSRGSSGRSAAAERRRDGR